LDCLNKALEIDPQNEKAWYNKGTMLLKIRKLDDAVSSFEKVLNINPKNSYALFNKGLALLYASKFHEALDCFETYLKQDYTYEPLIMKSVALLNLKKYTDAENSLQAAIQLDVKRFEAFFYLGLYYQRIDEYEEAQKFYDKALTKSDDPAIWTNKALIYYDQGLYQESITNLDKAEYGMLKISQMSPTNKYSTETTWKNSTTNGVED